MAGFSPEMTELIDEGFFGDFTNDVIELGSLDTPEVDILDAFSSTLPAPPQEPSPA